MDVRFTVKTRIARPAHTVFQAIVDPDQLCTYFTKSSTGALVPDAKITWTWTDGESEKIHVHEIVPDRKISFCWRAWKVGHKTEVTFDLVPEGADATVVQITEQGWKPEQDGLDSSYQHCSGWQHMLLCLRARLVHGIDLR